MSHNAKGPSSKSDQFLTWHAMYCNALQCRQNKPDLKKKKPLTQCLAGEYEHCNSADGEAGTRSESND